MCSIMALAYAGAGGAAVVLTLWMPQLVRSFGFGNGQTGLLTAIPVRHRCGLHVPVGAQF